MPRFKVEEGRPGANYYRVIDTHRDWQDIQYMHIASLVEIQAKWNRMAVVLNMSKQGADEVAAVMNREWEAFLRNPT